MTEEELILRQQRQCDSLEWGISREDQVRRKVYIDTLDVETAKIKIDNANLLARFAIQMREEVRQGEKQEKLKEEG